MPSAITRLTLALQQVTYPGYTFAIVGDTDALSGAFYLRASFMAPDTHTKALALQHTRKWLLSEHMTPSEVVQTALKCVLTSLEHEARENFKYMDAPVFGPHFDIDDLVVLCSQGGDTAGGRVDRRISEVDAAGFQG
nr:hypothetical protein [uncultured Albidiferax sp.]